MQAHEAAVVVAELRGIGASILCVHEAYETDVLKFVVDGLGVDIKAAW